MGLGLLGRETLDNLTWQQVDIMEDLDVSL